MGGKKESQRSRAKVERQDSSEMDEVKKIGLIIGAVVAAGLAAFSIYEAAKQTEVAKNKIDSLAKARAAKAAKADAVKNNLIEDAEENDN